MKTPTEMFMEWWRDDADDDQFLMDVAEDAFKAGRIGGLLEAADLTKKLELAIREAAE